MSESIKKGRMVVYACGGLGINVARLLNNVGTNPNTTADIEIIAIDTSESNRSPWLMSSSRMMLAMG